MASLTIGQVARQAEVGVETVRFYERQELIEEPPRTNSGYRQYSEEIVPRLRFIKQAQELGFSLREIRELLELRIGDDTSCGDIRERAEGKIEDIEQKVETLLAMKGVLERLVDACPGRGPVVECPILESVAEGNRR